MINVHVASYTIVYTRGIFVLSMIISSLYLFIVVQIARIFLSVGYDICFVVALVKTIRVAYIFFKVSPTKKVDHSHIKDDY